MGGCGALVQHQAKHGIVFCIPTRLGRRIFGEYKISSSSEGAGTRLVSPHLKIPCRKDNLAKLHYCILRRVGKILPFSFNLISLSVFTSQGLFYVLFRCTRVGDGRRSPAA